MHRYGIFELPIGAAASLASLLGTEAKRRSAAVCGEDNGAELLQNLADWLDARRERRPLSILGL